MWMTLCSQDQSFIEKVILKRRQQDLELEVEDSAAGFLGIHIARNAERDTMTLTHRGLEHRINDALQIDNLSPKETADFSRPLVADKDGEEAFGVYSY